MSTTEAPEVYCDINQPPLDLRGPMDDTVIERLAARNQERLKEAQEALGHRWVLWPTRQAA